MPSWRLAAFYAAYFASLGALLPFWALYLSHLGFTPPQIGQVIAVQMLTKILAPNLWAWIADRRQQHLAMVRMGSLLAALSFSLVFVVQSFVPMLMVVTLFSFFWNAVLPQFETITMNQLGDKGHRYSQIRLWGSAGFVLMALMLGVLVDRYHISILPNVLFLLFCAIYVASLMVARPKRIPLSHSHTSIGPILRRPEVIAFLLVNLLIQMAHGPYYTFYTIYLESTGYRGDLIGVLWSLGVIAEIVIFLLMPRWMLKWGIRRILLWSLWLSAVRWLLIGFGVQSLPLLLGAQILHAVSFGTCHAVAISFIHHYFVGPTQSRGQALYSSMGFGLGGVAGALYSGYAWERLGASETFFIAAIAVLLALAITWKYIFVNTDRSYIPTVYPPSQ
ncbi:MAG TPA: MFS transporter [Gammaproteobacteria bacterium]|nr:MFS transporter [Gammaproteobacteria bacterium]